MSYDDLKGWLRGIKAHIYKQCVRKLLEDVSDYDACKFECIFKVIYSTVPVICGKTFDNYDKIIKSLNRLSKFPTSLIRAP